MVFPSFKHPLNSACASIPLFLVRVSTSFLALCVFATENTPFCACASEFVLALMCCVKLRVQSSNRCFMDNSVLKIITGVRCRKCELLFYGTSGLLFHYNCPLEPRREIDRHALTKRPHRTTGAGRRV